MFTLKIHWARYARADADGPIGTADETTLFIPADQIRVHATIPAGERDRVMKHWHAVDAEPGYFNYLSYTDHGNEGTEMAGRLICVIRDGVESWYTATAAWVLGPTGSTIERVAP